MKLLLVGLIVLLGICIANTEAKPSYYGLNREPRSPQYAYGASTSASYFGFGTPYYNRGWGPGYHGHFGPMNPRPMGSTTVIKKTVIVNRP